MANVFSDIQNYTSGGASGQASSNLQGAVSTLAANIPPQLANLIPTLQLQVVQGTMTPAQAQAAIQQQSALNGIQGSPQATSAQMQALQQMQQVATNGGLTQSDKAQLQQISDQVNQQNQARQGAVMQQAAQQGIGGSGADLAARLSGAQSANQANSSMANNVAQDAQSRQLAAMSQSGQLAGQIQQQQFGQQATIGAAQNAVNQFNAGNQQQTNLANQNAQQNANTQNYQTANQVAGTNTGIQNTQNMLPYNTAIQQAGLNNQYSNSLASGQLSAGTGETKLAAQNNQATGNELGAIGSIVGGATGGSGNLGTQIGNAASSWFSDVRTKKDVKPMEDTDIEDILTKLTGKKYQYKKSSGVDDGKEHYGVMAQDLEKTPLKSAVHTDPNGMKQVEDNDDMRGATLAALANLHERMSALEGKN